jgi:hypothetical protein
MRREKVSTRKAVRRMLKGVGGRARAWIVSEVWSG